jgi:deoxyinosine 3'endonuclease (endonuclease V)
LKYIGAVDISYSKSDRRKAVAALIISEYPSMDVVYEDYNYVESVDAPYIPGFLGQREMPMYGKLWSKLKKLKPELVPQVFFVDGQGVNHT